MDPDATLAAVELGPRYGLAQRDHALIPRNRTVRKSRAAKDSQGAGFDAGHLPRRSKSAARKTLEELSER